MTALLFLGLLEVILRLLFPTILGYIEYHPTYGWTPLPNVHGTYRERGAFWDSEFVATITTNEFGTRTPYPPGPDADHRRILLLGDSFCFGWGISDDLLFSVELERQLNESRPPESKGPGDWQVVNLGMIGFGPDQELLLWEEMGRTYSPQIVLVFIFVGNDFSDIMNQFSGTNNALKPIYKNVGDRYVLSGSPVPYHWRWTVKHAFRESYLLYFVSWRLQRLRSAPEPPPPVKDSPLPRTTVFSEEERYRRMDFILMRLRDSITENGAGMRLVAIPTSEEWTSCRGNGSRSDFEKMVFLESWAENRGVPFLNLLDERRYLDAPSLYWTRDVHWNAEAQGVVATILRDWIVEDRLHP